MLFLALLSFFETILVFENLHDVRWAFVTDAVSSRERPWVSQFAHSSPTLSSSKESLWVSYLRVFVTDTVECKRALLVFSFRHVLACAVQSSRLCIRVLCRHLCGPF